MKGESVSPEHEFKIAEESYGTDFLDLILTKGYIGKPLANARVVGYLAQNQREIFDGISEDRRTRERHRLILAPSFRILEPYPLALMVGIQKFDVALRQRLCTAKTVPIKASSKIMSLAQ